MMRALSLIVLFCGLICAYLHTTFAAYPYYGTKIGALSQLHHGVSGDVYAVDSRTLFLKNFNYDGEAPAAYFYVGSSPQPTNEGSYRLRDDHGTMRLLKRYRNKDVTLSLPEGKTLRDFKWFSVWCDEFAVNFGDVRIPSNLDYPKPQKLAPLNGVHGVYSDNIVIVDAQTILVPNFSYDGEAPDAKFWVGRGSKPTPNGIRLADENGKETPLRRYDRKTIVLTLPGDLTVFDIGHFGVWCEAFTVDFGHIRIPEGLNVPPSLKMLGISPQSKLNCEVLYDDLAFEVRWAVAGESVVVQLVAKLDDNEYMGFGVSPNIHKTEMVGADCVVSWVDKESGKGFAIDYFLEAKSQCSGKHGSCPDTRLLDDTQSVRLLNAAMVNGYSIVTYQRSLKAADNLDLPIFLNGSQAIVWGIGPLNERSEVSFHTKYPKGDQFIDFGRQPTWNCPMPEDDVKMPDQHSQNEYYEQKPQQGNRGPQAPQQYDQQSGPQIQNKQDEYYEPQSQGQYNRQPASPPRGSTPPRRPVPTPRPAASKDAWEIPPIQCYEPEDGVFYAQMGPTGGKHGYPAITGHVGWGISWYINGLLIPEINVVRGKTYTFVVEGGNDPEIPAKYHPFYISDDPVGGYEYKTEEEKASTRIYAGVKRSRTGQIVPTGVGRLCNWTPDVDGPPADDYLSFGAYQRTLTLKCDEGEPGIITWTPDNSTPDTVYYQCFTHRYLGWRINVLDSCDEAQASEIDEVYAEPEDDMAAEASIRHETKLRPNDNFLVKHEKDLIKNHNMNETPPKLLFELKNSTELTKLITDGIRAAEALEETIKNPRLNQSYELPGTTNSHFLHGEVAFRPPNNQSVQVPLDHLVVPNVQISPFLRPPQNSPGFRPAKIPGRRPPPFQYERRQNVRPQRPVLLPQPSVIVNHYKKPIPQILRPFVKNQPFPIDPIASVLLLGQTTELGLPPRSNEPILKPKNKFGSIPVPYSDVAPLGSKPIPSISHSGPYVKGKKPFTKRHQDPEKYNSKPTLYKIPFDIKEDLPAESLRLAVNTGFQPDSVVVEGGFRPILRKRKDDDIDEEIEEVTNRRQDDDVSETADSTEGEALFFNQDKESQSFEPMFIPSPPDSTNGSVIVRKSIQHQKNHGDLDDMDFESGGDKVALAAERFESYYLPPDPKIQLNVAIPEGAVVAYDGKAVLDTSLLNNPPPHLHTTERRNGISKVEQLVRSTPQFGPFRGEMPPPVPNILPKDLPQISSQRLNNPITEYTNPISPLGFNSPISTKLSLLPKTRR